MELPSVETSSVAIKIEENYSTCLVHYDGHYIEDITLDGGIYSGRIIEKCVCPTVSPHWRAATCNEKNHYKIQIQVTRRQNELDHLSVIRFILVVESKVDCTTPCDENWLAKGQQCRVRWEGSVVIDGRVYTSALYNATLVDRNIDGTYIVLYADGERDICVAADRIFGEPWIAKNIPISDGKGFHGQRLASHGSQRQYEQPSRCEFFTSITSNPYICVGICCFMICIIILSSYLAACNAEYKKAEYGEKTCFN